VTAHAHLPALLGIEFDQVSAEQVIASLEIRDELLSPSRYLHAATLVGIADSACGYGTLAGLPEGATGFTTVELKANFLGTAVRGALRCEAHRRHGGASTHVWDAEVTSDDRVLALFRCTRPCARSTQRPPGRSPEQQGSGVTLQTDRADRRQ
jgi:1,4-dihydroxy-2-naphthoyl-CoA hydrolase